MPRLLSETVDTHRQAVRDATLDAAAALVAKGGIRSVTMSAVAEATGIGRATLYKYFPDSEAILLAWHERQVARHLEYLRMLGERDGSARDRLASVLAGYAAIRHEHGAEVALHRAKHVRHAERELKDFIEAKIRDCATDGAVRSDVPPAELAGYCVHALGAAAALPSKEAVRRLVELTLQGLRP